MPKKAIVFAGFNCKNNVVSICRIADALRFDEIIILGEWDGSAKHLTRKMFTDEGYPTKAVYFKTPEEIRDYIEKQGYTPVSMEIEPDATEVFDFKWPAKVAIIVGHEVTGIPKALAEITKKKVMLPMLGDVRNINVACAASIAMYDCFMKETPRSNCKPIRWRYNKTENN